MQKISNSIFTAPPLKRYIYKTKSGLMVRIPMVYKDGDYLKALELSVNALKKCNTDNKFIDDFYWWCFLSYAVYCAHMLKNNRIMSKLISISKNGFESCDGHYASYCFCRFSHFMYLNGEYERATDYAEKAMKADSTSGEPHYLLGYYNLFINDMDPLNHFKEAVIKDPSLLNRIVNHPSIQNFPSIINDLRRLEIVDFNDGSNHSVE